ncbi:MAG: hypothetical protein RI995_1980 [Bacteroidota bacterium]
MKNYLVYGMGFIVLTIQSCITVQVSPDAASNQKKYVQDDLYDTEVLFSTKTKKVKQQDYYQSNQNPDEIIIEEEEGIAQRAKQQNFLNSRSVYSNYDQGYSDGFRNGAFSSTPWNNWYSNPYINFGYTPYRSTLNITWGLSSFYSPFNSFYPSFSYGFGYLNPYYSMFNPFLDPFYGYYMPGLYMNYTSAYYYSNPYNYYSYLNSSSGYANYGSSYADQPQRRVVRGPREEGGSNRYNENYNGGNRAVANQYNGNFNNQNQVQNQPQRNIVDEYNRVQQRRNSNIEYTRPSNNEYQNSSRDQFFQQNRSTNFGNSSSNFSGGGGGSFNGGGGRGPR